MSRRAVAVAVLSLALAAAGCTTVPTHTAPQVIQPVAVDPQQSGGGPAPRAEPRSIVQGFLDANGDNDPNHARARLYLTPEERNRWSDQTATVVDYRNLQVGNLRRGKPTRSGTQTGTITVTGQQIGTVDASGAYKPFLRGNGSGLGAVALSQSYGLVKVRGEWRIDSLPPGLLVTTTQFNLFRQYPIYFYDSAGQNLVPVPRYTQLTDAQGVVSWLVSQLAAGPPPQSYLQTGLPPNAPNKVTVAYPPDPSDPTQPIAIDIPGAGGLDGGNLDRLAAQIAATIQQVLQVDRIQITDNGTPVRIPATGTTSFTTQDLAGRYQTTPPSSGLFYVRGGAVYQAGRPIPGKVGQGAYGLISAALTTRGTSNTLLVAGVRGSGDHEVLDVPDPHAPGSLVASGVQGRLSRPAWAPGRREVWIGDGSDLELVTGQHRVQTVQLEGPNGKATGDVTAVRISPDGGRVALVLTTADSSQIYVGNIVRSATEVSVPVLTPISPQGVRVTDVAWNDELKLFAIGKDARTGEEQVYETQCDGSIWAPRGNLGLPGPPDAVTAASGAEAVVSAGQTIWQQNGASWQGLLNGETFGTNPVYLE